MILFLALLISLKIIDKEGVIKTYSPDDHSESNTEVYDLLVAAVKKGAKVNYWKEIGEEIMPNGPETSDAKRSEVVKVKSKDQLFGMRPPYGLSN